MRRAPEQGAEELQAALSSVAQAIAHTLEVEEVWGRVADACRAVVPFDGMGVSRLVPGDRVRVAVAAGDPAARGLQERVFARDDFSPRLWPRDEPYVVLVRDAPRELDLSFPADREVAGLGFRSILRLPLGRGDEKFGSLVLVSRTPDRFTEEHAHGLSMVAEMVTLALAHEKMAHAWRERSKRRQALERLIPALAGSLDVREVFEKIVRIAEEILPNDLMGITLLSQDRRSERAYAKYGLEGDVQQMPEFPVPPQLLAALEWDSMVLRDVTVLPGNRARMHLVHPPPPAVAEVQLDEFWVRVYSEMGIRSLLRANIRFRGAAIGGFVCGSRAPDRYDDEHVEFAMRVADHVALAIAHQRLAEEARRAAAAQDRATHLEQRVHHLARELETRNPHRALGRSPRWRDTLNQATKVAHTDTTVLLTGESGTGKEVLARFIHRGSPRKDGPFVALNCAALPEQLLESELFGHERGAFTGALDARAGKIEQAAGGVLFLDEVGEMSPAVQAKFLRVLQEREYQRLGGARTLKADVRVLAATNRNLKAAITKGAFREDLYYRLAVFDITLPPLRERPEDVLLLVEAFLEEIGRSVGRPAAGVSRDAREKILEYPWPGNVRELRNAVERAVILCEGGLITSDHLPMGVATARATSPETKPAPSTTGGTLDAVEKDMIAQALARAGNNQSKAARQLGISRAQLRSRIEKHGL
jgi:transcriptional regulator with GAF, ATPase, and Fis domain